MKDISSNRYGNNSFKSVQHDEDDLDIEVRQTDVITGVKDAFLYDEDDDDYVERQGKDMLEYEEEMGGRIEAFSMKSDKKMGEFRKGHFVFRQMPDLNPEVSDSENDDEDSEGELEDRYLKADPWLQEVLTHHEVPMAPPKKTFDPFAEKSTDAHPLNQVELYGLVANYTRPHETVWQALKRLAKVIPRGVKETDYKDSSCSDSEQNYSSGFGSDTPPPLRPTSGTPQRGRNRAHGKRPSELCIGAPSGFLDTDESSIRASTDEVTEEQPKKRKYRRKRIHTHFDVLTEVANLLVGKGDYDVYRRTHENACWMTELSVQRAQLQAAAMEEALAQRKEAPSEHVSFADQEGCISWEYRLLDAAEIEEAERYKNEPEKLQTWLKDLESLNSTIAGCVSAVKMQSLKSAGTFRDHPAVARMTQIDIFAPENDWQFANDVDFVKAMEPPAKKQPHLIGTKLAIQ